MLVLFFFYLKPKLRNQKIHHTRNSGCYGLLFLLLIVHLSRTTRNIEGIEGRYVCMEKFVLYYHFYLKPMYVTRKSINQEIYETMLIVDLF